MIIYCIRNKVNNKRYIGQTRLAPEHRYPRFDFGRYGSNRHLRNSYNRYGEDAFSFEILRHCSDLESLNYWEKFYIEAFKTFDRTKGYNKEFGGQEQLVTEEARQRNSKAQKRYFAENPKELQRLQKQNKDYWAKPESRKKKSQQMKEVCNRPEKQLANSIRQGAKPFRAISVETNEIIGVWVNKAECARALNLDRKKISGCLLGYRGRKTHKGFRFEYEVQNDD